MAVDIDMARLDALYREYVDGFRDSGGALAPMMELKLAHTGRVVANAAAIADGERVDSDTALVARAAALLHDTGRYEQLRRYGTFRDSESVDHAVFSHDIVASKGWLDNLETPVREAILNAVLFHNRKDLPPDFVAAGSKSRIGAIALAAARIVRDADKLDIFRVLEELVAGTDWRRDRSAFWGLNPQSPPSEAVLEAIKNGAPVDYQLIKSLADFVLIQVGWIFNGLEYPFSRQLARERGHLEFRRRFLRELVDDPRIEALFNARA